MVASAAETRVVPQGVPEWRVIAGDLAAGATAGGAVEMALYPIDTIKTRLQAMTRCEKRVSPAIKLTSG